MVNCELSCGRQHGRPVHRVGYSIGSVTGARFAAAYVTRSAFPWFESYQAASASL